MKRSHKGESSAATKNLNRVIKVRLKQEEENGYDQKPMPEFTLKKFRKSAEAGDLWE